MRSKESKTDLFDYNCDFSFRTIWLGSETVSRNGDESGVDAALAERAVKAIYLLDKAAPSGDKPINILLNNPGGDVIHCAAIYDAIRCARNEIIITVYGMAMSAGSIILQAANKRILTPSSTVMIHEGEGGFYGHPKNIENWIKHAKRVDKWAADIYLQRIREKHPSYKLKDLQKLLTFDTILTAEEAVELGLADEIL